MNEEKAMQVLDGLMLGDGSLERNGKLALLNLSLSAGDPNRWRDTLWSGRKSKIPEMQYLVYIMDRLEPLGVRFCKEHPKAIVRHYHNGKPYLYCYIESLSSVFLSTQFKRWYRPITDEVRKTRWFAANRKWYKILPDDIMLTPLSLAVWFEGDGNTVYNPLPRVQLRIATSNFSHEEVTKLSGLLHLLSIQAQVSKAPTNTQITWILNVGAIDSVNTFLGITKEYIQSCYRYKIKMANHKPRRRADCFDLMRRQLRMKRVTE